MRNPASVAHSLDVLRRQFGIAPTDAFDNICERWPQVVGIDLARFCAPGSLRSGVLYLSVSDPAATEAVQLRKAQILAAVREIAGDATVHDIAIRTRRH
jgi:predicted nucleic acid-binding Zn ribbon protein